MMAAAREGWSFACPDWKERLSKGESLVPELPIDAKEAARAVAIFNRLRLPDVAGAPSLGESGGEWVRDLVAPLFGSIDADGVRHVGEFLTVVPKKNIKTTGGAGIMLTALLAEDPKTSRNQQFHLYGPTQPIAELAFWQAVGMIRADPEGYLQKRFHIREHLKSIKDLATDNELRVKTFDMKVSTGTIPKGVLVDELHILGSMHYAQRVVGQIRGGLITRKDSFLGFITTQSDEPPAGEFRAELMLARAIRDGTVTGKAARMLPLIYEFPEEVQTSDQWRDPKIWHWVNPNLGHSVTLDRLEADWAQAQEKGEEEVRRWASQHLNVEVGLALHSERWRGADFWQDAAAPEVCRDLDVLLARCEVVVIGADGGGLDDLFGICVLGRDKITGVWLYWVHAIAHRIVLERRKEIAPLLLEFEREGDLTLWGNTSEPGPRVAELLAAKAEDAEAMAAARDARSRAEDIVKFVGICTKVRDAGLLPESGGIGLDPAQIGAVLDALERAGFTLSGHGSAGIVEAVNQTAFNMFSAINTLERKLEEGSAAHGGTRLMAWSVSNAKAELKGNSVAITKQASGKAKIDTLIAAFCATKLMERNPEAAGNDNGGLNAWVESLRSEPKAKAA